MSSIPSLFELSPPSEDAGAVDVMKWMISVMNKNDKYLMFVSSVLSHCISHSGMTERQANAVEGIYGRILNEFSLGLLEIQGGTILADADGQISNVTRLVPRKAAS